MSEEKIELIPDAHLLLMSLRSVGYKTETAIADIIDNSISADASEKEAVVKKNGRGKYMK